MYSYTSIQFKHRGHLFTFKKLLIIDYCGISVLFFFWLRCVVCATHSRIKIGVVANTKLGQTLMCGLEEMDT